MKRQAGVPCVSVLVPCTRPDLVEGIAEALARESETVPCELLIAGHVGDLDPGTFAVPTTLIDCDPNQLNRMRRHLADLARGPVMAFLDDDAVPAPGWLTVASTLPHDALEIWTGPESPTRQTPGAILAAELSSSLMAEGYRGHIGTGDRPVRWFEVPFCNLVVSRQLVDAVGLPASTLAWDLDDFDFCRRADAYGATFRTRDDLAILHDRYPDEFGAWLRRKARERRRTGEKLVRYPAMYARIPSVVILATAPWACLGGFVWAGRRRRAVSATLLAVYAGFIAAQAHRRGCRGQRALEFSLGLASLHLTSAGALQAGILQGVTAAAMDIPDPNLPTLSDVRSIRSVSLPPASRRPPEP